MSLTCLLGSRRPIVGALLLSMLTWLLPHTMRAAVLAESFPDRLVRPGSEPPESRGEDDLLRERLARAVADMLALQQAFSVQGPAFVPGVAKSKTSFLSVRAHRPTVPSRVLPFEQGVRATHLAGLLRILSSAHPLGP